MPLLHPSSAAPAWRTVALVEHHGGNTDPADPDFEGGGSDPTTYEAIRISAGQLPGFSGPVEAVYVEYQDRADETEFYDLTKDPYELPNIAKRSDRRGARHVAQDADVTCQLSHGKRVFGRPCCRGSPDARLALLGVTTQNALERNVPFRLSEE